MSINTTITDTRTIQVGVPASNADTEQLGKFVEHGAQEGYFLSGAATVQGGDQRDPYTVGIKLTLRKSL